MCIRDSLPSTNESEAAAATAMAAGAGPARGAASVPATGENPPRLIPAMLLNRHPSSVRLGIGSDSKRDVYKRQVFDLYIRQQWPVLKVARELKTSPASIYLIGHRLTKQLKAEVAKLRKQLG